MEAMTKTKENDDLTKREYAAIQIMAGFTAGEKTMISEYKIAAALAVKWADALLAELNKDQRPE